MFKSIKYIFVIALVPLLFAGCNSLFDMGDTEKSYDGSDLVEFKPLETEIQVEIESDGTHDEVSREINVQLISSQGVASSDVSVSYSVDDESSADASHYNLSANSVTITSGSASASFTITIPSDAPIGVGDEFDVILNMTEVSGAEAAANLDQAIVFIRGVEPQE